MAQAKLVVFGQISLVSVISFHRRRFKLYKLRLLSAFNDILHTRYLPSTWKNYMPILKCSTNRTGQNDEENQIISIAKEKQRNTIQTASLICRDKMNYQQCNTLSDKENARQTF
jgi:hypothetical protein